MRGMITDPSAPGGLRLADDLPEPGPGPSDVVIEVHAFSVNRGELKLLNARSDGWQPGQDVSGVVVASAQDGTGPAEGTRVVGIVDGAGWSERASVELNRLAPIPDSVSHESAAGLPVAGLTALRALRTGGPILGRRVLVTGATGGVGQFAVQLAVASGARVTAQVSGPHRSDEARALGASEVVTSLDDETLGPFDLVLDGVGGPLLRSALLRCAPKATVTTYGSLGGPGAEIGLPAFANAPLARVMGLFVYALGTETMGVELASLVELVADGRLKPRLGLISDWEATNDVLDAMRERKLTGKAVLTVSH
ncbi:MAG: zinc-binding dehydrogenase [Actinomycetota bacterium]